MRIESVSIVTNGSLVKRDWFVKYAQFLDIIAVSCDSFDETTNIQIGRGKGAHLETVIKLRNLCQEFGIKLKVNTVVNRYNVSEDMNEGIRLINPFRWKVFQVLIVTDENDSRTTLRVGDLLGKSIGYK